MADQKLAKQIIELLGNRKNIVTVNHCMTRLRVEVLDESKVQIAELKKTPGVMGIIQDDTIQVVLGPGKVSVITERICEILGIQKGEKVPNVNSEKDLDQLANETKNKYKTKNKTPFKMFLRKIGQIFIPLLPGIIGAGLLNGIVKFAEAMGVDKQIAIMQILAFISQCLFGYLAIFIGMNTTKEFGGTPVLGGIIGLVVFNPAIKDLKLTIFGESLTAGRGGIIAVLIAAYLVALVERNLRKIVPVVLDVIITPMLTLIMVGLATFYVVQPVGGLLAEGITSSFEYAMDIGGPVAGYILSALFLPLVLTGLHHGLIPIHTELLNSLGGNPLLPILAMAGAGEVGAAIAIWIKTKNKRLKSIIPGALVPGFMGIGEPLMYAVTIPLGRPFITACLGGGLGGAFVAWVSIKVSAVGGISGIPLALTVLENKYLLYLAGVLIAYIGGFILTYLFGYKEEMASQFD
ncbi:PTS transporter subunit EIIC [Risungbinella massiliensis]|uniref:PTS transporter subunit EIIC n=1 Tax=Risungbinella massiliensis TaxID=1329796 RepID=UPI0005CBBEBC|nr:PTS transporter subunit EIIC [Risungbinella massiliensis]